MKLNSILLLHNEEVVWGLGTFNKFPRKVSIWRKKKFNISFAILISSLAAWIRWRRLVSGLGIPMK